MARTRWSPRDRRSVAVMALVVVLLHVVGFGALFGLIEPAHLHLGGGGVFTAGVGLLAYTFGLRHAFDADHIAAIDNTTRKLLTSRRPDEPRPMSVGFWFGAGHSTVVFALCLALGAGVRALSGQIADENSRLHAVTGVIGGSVSGGFLWLLGLINLVALVGLVRIVRDLRAGRFDEAALEKQLQSRGFLNRLLGPLTRAVRKPSHIYPVGVLFGLGFDTASEVGLLVLAGGAAAYALPFWAMLVLPILFAAGMILMDTADGIFMAEAYGWADAAPVRTLFYNLTVTTLSVAVALGIGTIELVGVLVDTTGISGGPLGAIAGIDLGHLGYVIVGLFALTWVIALSAWKFGNLEQRWAPRTD
ncbi:nickel/cobalt efflux system [Nocardioides baekrokdamisoli]|uniref:Nickel/cobalt efflux system n=1 Tax=Nocardioides baekrokdamisoli TaxID=1804624 RepID=A0A3G9IF20_9ACTN|nr:HoxN/HupN/NixA family nickel/cobalt transporter [Nocardioides baekrokdamisoli]BBH16892.1 nickel/cobalt efflux system [Nocardioides baekrokdamisoli]